MPLHSLGLRTVEVSVRTAGTPALVPRVCSRHLSWMRSRVVSVIGSGLEAITGRVGVVVITLASHARGREFNPRIRYFSFSIG